MSAMLIAVAIGGLAGVLSGGRLRNLGQIRKRGWPLLLAAVAGELLLGELPAGVRWPLAVAACLAVVGWCALNHPTGRTSKAGWRPAGADLLGAGAAANLVVMAANGGMPVSRWALVRAGFAPGTEVSRGHLYKHVPMTAGTHLRFLADVIPFRPLAIVVSGGDVLMLIGIATLVWAGTRIGTAVAEAPGQRAGLATGV